MSVAATAKPLRTGISSGNIDDLPAFSTGPHGSPAELHEAVARADYEGPQGGDKVRVANTEGNARAIGPSRTNLGEIDVSGWHGPARLVPFVNRKIKLT